MADKAISELVAAEQITATDMFVLEQNNTAKKLTGQTLLNWLTKVADGHGGISSIEKLSTSGLTDTYRITLADTTTFDFPVTNGKSISSIAKQSTSGLVDTYKISYNDGTYTTFTVTNGAKGDKGDNAYLWIKYASQEPTSASHSMSDIPDNWIGVYSGNSATAPTDYTQYKWFQFKGEKGDTGSPATLSSSKVEYQVSDSGAIIPSGSWSTSVPVVAQGKYLWTRTTTTFNTGEPVVSYSVSRMGLDGTGSVSSVAGISPNSDGNVPLTAEDLEALPTSGGTMTGEINMSGQPISGLNQPTESTQAANKGYVDTAVSKAAPRNLLDNSDFRNPVNQRGKTEYTGTYAIDRWRGWESTKISITSNGIKIEGGELFQYLMPSACRDVTHTLAVKCTDGTTLISAANPHSNFQRFDNGCGLGTDTNITIAFPEGEFEWVALYEGEYTAETLPEYQAKGYGAELAECQRYYYRTCKNVQMSGHLTGNALDAYGYLYIPEMRITPTLVNSLPSMTIRTISGYSDIANNTKPFATPASQTVAKDLSNAAGEHSVMFVFDSVVGTNNTPISINLRDGSSLEFSADL